MSELIEHERVELMQIHAMVRCLNDVLLYADDDDSPMHADVALVIGRLLNDSVVRLEGVRARVAQMEQVVMPPNQVRDCPQLDDVFPWRTTPSEPWLMVRDCLDIARTGDTSCKPSSRNWVS
ncbi:hypothetical protein [Peristeroidobacter soli]|uniref:hypothetical protein n=1 Tax=Peristeroidobacter soli TaxID=2497877 RepID=UPI00101C48F3|nr:hypothetical protein [Peristeroidobacter soli]